MIAHKIKNKLEVPSFECIEFLPKRSIYCVCIPVINEGEKIKKQLLRMKDIANELDIIIADGGSTDGSLNHKFLKKCKVRTLLTKTGPGKLSAQIRMALAYGLKQKYKGFVFIDGNNKDDPSAIPTFINKLKAGFDYIQGSRFIKGGRAINTPFIRYFAIRLIHAPLLSLVSGRWYTDTTNGFRAYSTRMIRDPRINIFRNIFSEYELLFYLTIISSKLKYKTIEIPVTREYPKKGEIPTKISPIIGMIKILKTTLKASLGYYNPKYNQHIKMLLLGF